MSNNKIIKLLLITSCTLLLLSKSECQKRNYEIGENMFVVALNGVKLRDLPSDKSQTKTILRSGNKISVLEVEIKKDIIFDFPGFWTKVITQDSTIGYIFDAFLSTIPLPEKDPIQENPYFFTPLKMLKDYAIKNFRPEVCNFTYDIENGSEKSHKEANFIILQEENKIIDGVGWEHYFCEFHINNVRNSEVYYLIKHLLEHFKDDEMETYDLHIKNPSTNSLSAKYIAISHLTNFSAELIKKGEMSFKIDFRQGTT